MKKLSNILNMSAPTMKDNDGFYDTSMDKFDPWEDEDDFKDGTLSNSFKGVDILGHYYNGSLTKRNLNKMLNSVTDLEKNQIIKELITEVEYMNGQFGNSSFTNNERAELEKRIVYLREQHKNAELKASDKERIIYSKDDYINKQHRREKLLHLAIARLGITDKINSEIDAQIQQERNLVEFEKMFEENMQNLDTFEDKINFDK